MVWGSGEGDLSLKCGSWGRDVRLNQLLWGRFFLRGLDYMEYAVGVGFFRFHLNFFFHPLFGFFWGWVMGNIDLGFINDF